jgi:hypothetical protein
LVNRFLNGLINHLIEAAILLDAILMRSLPNLVKVVVVDPERISALVCSARDDDMRVRSVTAFTMDSIRPVNALTRSDSLPHSAPSSAPNIVVIKPFCVLWRDYQVPTHLGFSRPVEKMLLVARLHLLPCAVP